MQMKQRVHLPMKLCDQEGIWKTQFTDSLSPKIKPSYITCKILHESSVARFPASLQELTPITDAYQWNAMTIWNRL